MKPLVPLCTVILISCEYFNFFYVKSQNRKQNQRKQILNNFWKASWEGQTQCSILSCSYFGMLPTRVLSQLTCSPPKTSWFWYISFFLIESYIIKSVLANPATSGGLIHVNSTGLHCVTLALYRESVFSKTLLPLWWIWGGKWYL